MEPPTKRTRAGTKGKARAALAHEFAEDLLARRARELTTWPKPRAAIALDVHVYSRSASGARVDSICKWLLDELAGHVYADDRQVKMLFARVARTQPLPPILSPPVDPDTSWPGDGDHFADLHRMYADAVKASATPQPSKLYITAQTRGNVFADLRAVSNLEERWDPFGEEHGLDRVDPVKASFHRDDLLEYRAIYDTDSEEDARERRLLANQIDYLDQAQQQHGVDVLFSSLFTDLPVDRFGVWNRVKGRINFTPYVFDVGVLPGHGESAAFRDRFRALLEERRRQWPNLFPMRARSGISMVLFEDPGGGKDLDNLIRAVLPDILDVLRPQRDDLPGWVADEADPEDGVPDVPFIEVAAFPSHLADMPPGSVVFGLSTADRYDSWWDLATDHLERVLESEEGEWW